MHMYATIKAMHSNNVKNTKANPMRDTKCVQQKDSLQDLVHDKVAAAVELEGGGRVLGSPLEVDDVERGPLPGAETYELQSC